MSICQFSRPKGEKISFPSAQTWAIFYTEKLYCNSLEKIQIGFISDKNISRYTCVLLQFLGETLLGKITASLFAHDGTITNEGILLYWVRMERLLAESGAHIFFFFFVSFVQTVVKRQSWRHSMKYAATFSSPRLNSRACAHLHKKPYVYFGQYYSRSC